MNKHVITIIMFLAWTFTLKAINTIEIEGSTYNILSATDFTCELYKSNGDLQVYLPSTIQYNGKTLNVLGVAQGALDPSFEKNEGLAFLHITEDCQYIGNQQYLYENRYSALTVIVIPSLESYLEMDYSTQSPKELFLEDGTCLTNGHLDLPSKMRYFNCSNAFAFCSNLTSVSWSIDQSIPEIDEEFECVIQPYTFVYCNNLERVSMPSCIIGPCAFQNCSKLSSVTISGSKLYTVDSFSFAYCENLEKIDGLLAHYINRGGFNYCKALKELSFANRPILIYSDYNKINYYPYDEFYYGAFYNCMSLNRINIPNIETILQFKYFHFDKNGKMEEYFKEPNALFYNCEGGSIYIDGKKLCEVAFNEPNTEINSGIFYNVPNLKINLDNVSSIGSYAFNRCKLDEIIVPRSVKRIGEYAISANTVEFEQTTSYYSKPLADDVENLKIEDCESLLNFDQAPAPSKNIKSIIIRNLNCDIPQYAFKDCSALEVFDVEDNNNSTIISIGGHAFDGTAIKYFKIPSNVCRIGRKAFEGLSLETLEIASSVDITLYCNYPGNTTSWLGDSFNNCYNLSTLIINKENNASTYFDRDTPFGYFSLYPWSKSNIKRVVFGDKMETANVDFYVTGYEGYQTYQFGTYYNPTSSTLEELEFGETIQRIYLKGNNYVGSVTASYDKSKIKSITLKSITPPELAEGSFSDWSLINATVTVPDIAIEEYKRHPVWGKFWNIQGEDFPDSGIVGIPTAQTNRDIYTLQGVLLKRNATVDDINTLPNGIYIIGGQKHIIRN